MLNFVLLCGFLCYNILICSCNANAMIGTGKWNVLKIEDVKGNFDEVEFNLQQRKLNRTHSCFQGNMVFHEELGAQFGAKIEVCKYVDGGCKQYLVLSDESFPSMMEQYAMKNMRTMFEGAGLEKFDWPVPAGKYEIEEYLFDFDELPEEGPYGEFDAVACCMKGTVEVGCVKMRLEFAKNDDDDE